MQRDGGFRKSRGIGIDESGKLSLKGLPAGTLKLFKMLHERKKQETQHGLTKGDLKRILQDYGAQLTNPNMDPDALLAQSSSPDSAPPLPSSPVPADPGSTALPPPPLPSSPVPIGSIDPDPTTHLGPPPPLPTLPPPGVVVSGAPALPSVGFCTVSL